MNDPSELKLKAYVKSNTSLVSNALKEIILALCTKSDLKLTCLGLFMRYSSYREEQSKLAMDPNNPEKNFTIALGSYSTSGSLR